MHVVVGSATRLATVSDNINVTVLTNDDVSGSQTTVGYTVSNSGGGMMLTSMAFDSTFPLTTLSDAFWGANERSKVQRSTFGITKTLSMPSVLLLMAHCDTPSSMPVPLTSMDVRPLVL